MKNPFKVIAKAATSVVSAALAVILGAQQPK